MIIVELECMYCGNKWQRLCRSKEEIEAQKCNNCGDSTLKVRDASTAKMNYYAGSKPFPEKSKEVNWDDFYGSSD